MSDVLVPHNRWDLLPAVPTPTVTVVVTHYEQPRQLAAVLAALGPDLEVVVADDGSRELPVVPPGVRLVRQEDLGFRAAAARNLGASVATGDVLVFLDADTVPEPGFVEAVVRRPAACRDVLAVGRRRHADLSGTGQELPEPAWLRDGYRDSRDLLDADGGSFRFVISAVLACRRELFADLGGFDERFVGYGGEDWDLAYRAWNNGAVLVHEPAAVAWHDGPDQGGRGIDPAVKQLETDRLAYLVPEPGTRRGRQVPELPDVLVDAPSDDRCRRALAAQTHADLALRGPDDPPWSTDQVRRARAQLQLHGCLPPDGLHRAVAHLIEQDLGSVTLTSAGQHIGTLTSTRALGRARRWPEHADVIGSAFGRSVLQVAD